MVRLNINYFLSALDLTRKIIMFLFTRVTILLGKQKILFIYVLNKTYKGLKYVWTPIFKRSSYISFLTFLKRFTKRK